MITTQCPDCDGALEEGAILDFSYSRVFAERYAKTKVPTGKKVGLIEGQYNDVRRVISKRCTVCNRIFSYAQNEVIIADFNSTNNKIQIFIFIFIVIVLIIGLSISMLGY